MAGSKPYQLRRMQSSIMVAQRKLAILAKELDVCGESAAWALCSSAAEKAELAVKHLNSRVAKLSEKKRGEGGRYERR